MRCLNACNYFSWHEVSMLHTSNIWQSNIHSSKYNLNQRTWSQLLTYRRCFVKFSYLDVLAKLILFRRAKKLNDTWKSRNTKTWLSRKCLIEEHNDTLKSLNNINMLYKNQTSIPINVPKSRKLIFCSSKSRYEIFTFDVYRSSSGGRATSFWQNTRAYNKYT